MTQQIFAIVAPLFLIVGVGYLYGVRERPAMDTINSMIMDIFVPALIFHVMIQDDFEPLQYSVLMAAGALVMLGSGIIAFGVARVMGFAWRSFVPPAMFCNWANLGLPLYVFALGEQALGGGIMLVVVGNVMCFTIGTYIYSGKLSGFEVLRTPIIAAVVLGALLNALNVHLPLFVDRPIDMLGQVAIPLMLFSLGVRLTRVSWNDSLAGFVMAALCPIAGVSIALVLVQLLPMPELQRNILILFGVLPPAVINFMLAEQYNRDPEKVASMVMIGNLSSVVTIPLILYFVLAA
ncbi:MAG: AEC family transporter [Gammaproteobacteria bacterium]|nr:AEC family transporter [Gammaproteobacteria bacterium]